ncbi:MAG TPA: hypothetical protein DDW71_01115 [Lactobacillus sp.]|nr:hypothetical protein [Lactobacillus sp.]
MAQFDEQLDSWLDQVAEVPLVNNMSEADQQKVILIDSLVLQVSIEGYVNNLPNGRQKCLPTCFLTVL